MIYNHELVGANDFLDNLDLQQKMPKMKLTSLRYLLDLIFKQTFTLSAKKQLNVCFEGVFLLINTSVTSSHLDI